MKRTSRREPIGPISPIEFHLLVRAGRVGEAIVRLGRQRIARIFNAIRELFPQLGPELVGEVVYRAVVRLAERAHRIEPHHSLARWLFALAYGIARSLTGGRGIQA